MVVTFEKFLSEPVVQEFLTTIHFRNDSEKEYILKKLYNTQKRHHLSWESEEKRNQHSLDNIEKIRWDVNNKCFKVYYKKTKDSSSTWYHYDLNGNWY